ncbi:hypothetical protein DM860_005677 [Cuscuta australis]|uniref:Glycosyl transferase family 28 C-terminal domain-containing protein n=1 Tax=Cuscuta australis TaxID=267555 RepID=A0A328DVZ1_9ASTE|nr:hypothetical protein DM860_005677 [Cuscuta australis]
MRLSSVSQEPTKPAGYLSNFDSSVFDHSQKPICRNFVSCGVLPNPLCFNGLGGRSHFSKRKVLCLSTAGSASARIGRALNLFNRAIRIHCEKVPLGFASIQAGSLESNGVSRDGNGVLEDEGIHISAVQDDAPKTVLILMSDTGGGHRASAEAIKAAFSQEFGEKYQIVNRSYIFCFFCRFHKLVTRCYAPSDEVAHRAIKAGLRFSQIKIFGLPVRPSFVKPVRPKDELRDELGMNVELPAVLLIGGGEGMGPIEATARALDKALYNAKLGEPMGQLLIVCGRNKRLTDKLLSIDWKVPVKVKGFVTKMEECMGACDCIISKAGPGTIAEAMIRGLPIILNDYIAGQEAGNVPFVVDNGCGKFSKVPKEIANIVRQWFGPKRDELEAMSRNCLRMARPDAVFKIVRDMDELLTQRSFAHNHYCPA